METKSIPSLETDIAEDIANLVMSKKDINDREFLNKMNDIQEMIEPYRTESKNIFDANEQRSLEILSTRCVYWIEVDGMDKSAAADKAEIRADTMVEQVERAVQQCGIDLTDSPKENKGIDDANFLEDSSVSRESKNYGAELERDELVQMLISEQSKIRNNKDMIADKLTGTSVDNLVENNSNLDSELCENFNKYENKDDIIKQEYKNLIDDVLRKNSLERIIKSFVDSLKNEEIEAIRRNIGSNYDTTEVLNSVLRSVGGGEVAELLSGRSGVATVLTNVVFFAPILFSILVAVVSGGGWSEAINAASRTAEQYPLI